ncbi:shTK domain protein [Dictyocaulus viviparus]|uniref:ShTK domain protein n=1 Tax=Dictyocaulus viviparus TaxID=29172 RepID=A0A0D8Y241_DICVI|nr:shTK domain protein [Dictyocaulus viviparus]
MLFIAIVWAKTVVGDFNCSQAPGPDMQTTCRMIQEWDSNARKAIRRRQVLENSIERFMKRAIIHCLTNDTKEEKNVRSFREIKFDSKLNSRRYGAPGLPNNPNFSPAIPQRFAPSAQACMNIPCICPYMGGRITGNGCILPNGQPYLKALRKEYRMMTDNERTRWNHAILQLKRSGEYDRLSVMHRQVGSSSGAHSGPGFLPWHREYMKRLEIALRMIDPGLSLPYWDSVMDSYLPDPRDSIMFSDFFMGDTDGAGQLVRGPFAGFRTLEGRPNIVRRLATEGKLLTEANINNLLSQTEIQNVLAYTAPQTGCPFRPNFGALEYTHSSVHLWIGGDMKPPSTSANDPIFFLHHCFVDFIWEMWRQSRQNRYARETAYPPDIGTCANSQHFSYAQMRPWDKQNRDGLSNEYTDNLYRYAPRATCSLQNTDCGSPYLFCDTRGNPHCVSKIKPNGLCRGFEEFDACWQGSCVASWCRPGQLFRGSQTKAISVQVTQRTTKIAPRRQTTTNPPRLETTSALSVRTTTQQPNTPSPLASNNCYNDDPCCDAWAREGECSVNIIYMNRYCRRSCRLCMNPTDNRIGCHDRHLSCPFWSMQNYCTRRRQWMAENCQASCGWCNMGPAQLCASVAFMSRA